MADESPSEQDLRCEIIYAVDDDDAGNDAAPEKEDLSEQDLFSVYFRFQREFLLQTLRIPREEIIKNKGLLLLIHSIENWYRDTVEVHDGYRDFEDISFLVSESVESLERMFATATKLLREYRIEMRWKNFAECYNEILQIDHSNAEAESIQWRQETSAIVVLRETLDIISMPEKVRFEAEVLFELLDLFDRDIQRLDDLYEALETGKYDSVNAFILSDLVDFYADTLYQGDINRLLEANGIACDLQGFFDVSIALSTMNVEVLDSEDCKNLLDGLRDFLACINRSVVKRLLAIRVSLNASKIPTA